MLLVYDDQAAARHWREHGRTRADDDVGLATRSRQPGTCALAVGEARMHHFDARLEAFAETTQRLRGQADLGHEYEHLPAARHDLLDQREIDLGLAAAGDAFEQGRGEAAEACRDRGDGDVL